MSYMDQHPEIVRLAIIARQADDGYVVVYPGVECAAKSSVMINVYKNSRFPRKRLVVDLDGTLTIDDPSLSYADKTPNAEGVARLRDYRELGFEIVIQTARNMRTYGSSVGKITAHTVPVLVDWLRRHDIPYDEIHVAKPWCGTEGFLIDDRAVRPDEFVRMSLAEIHDLLCVKSE